MQSTHVGPEGRYLNRFSKIKRVTNDGIKDFDSAGNLTEHLTQARASIKTQEKNTAELFATAQELIAGIDTCQQMFGLADVKNLPLPPMSIRQSPAQQLGYVQLTMRFLQAGVIHFMEEMNEANVQINRLESLLSKLAVHDHAVPLLGELQSLDIEQLEKLSMSTNTMNPEMHTPPSTPSVKYDEPVIENSPPAMAAASKTRESSSKKDSKHRK